MGICSCLSKQIGAFTLPLRNYDDLFNDDFLANGVVCLIENFRPKFLNYPLLTCLIMY